ncbi:hypothetical protein A2U01_0117048, partial [Trifolium medium]|nr:hypothetical protein [Trifolium medium]
MASSSSTFEVAAMESPKEQP